MPATRFWRISGLNRGVLQVLLRRWHGYVPQSELFRMLRDRIAAFEPPGRARRRRYRWPRARRSPIPWVVLDSTVLSGHDRYLESAAARLLCASQLEGGYA
jgi:hypothetical protein